MHKNDPFTTPPAIYGEVEAGRSAKIRAHLENIRQTLSTINYDIAEMLVEATERNWFAEWGYPSRSAFIEQNLDMKERAAEYLMRVVIVSKQMNIPRNEIEHIGISKLREIFSLNPDNKYFNPETQENEPLDDHIRRLLVIAPSTGHEAIKSEVKRLKGLVGENELTWMNYQITRSSKDNVILPGMEAFRKYLGDKGAVEKEGSREYSDGFVLEMVFAEVLSGAPTPGDDIEDEVEQVTDDVEAEIEEEV